MRTKNVVFVVDGFVIVVKVLLTAVPDVTLAGVLPTTILFASVNPTVKPVTPV